MAAERLNKILAHLGYGSRRAVDTLIADGKVMVNQTPAHLGQKVEPTDTITLQGRTIIRHAHEPVVIAFYKPRGVTTTRKDRFAKVTVMDYLSPDLQHVYPIGRLDKDSRGLLLLTNDGNLAERLTHPRYGHEKEYVVTVTSLHPITAKQFDQAMRRLQTSIIQPHVQTKPIRVVRAAFHPQQHQGTVTVVLTEGKKRQIREIFAALGYEVIDLLRTRIGGVTLEHLREGEYVRIDPAQFGSHPVL